MTFVGSHAGDGGSERILELLVDGLGPAWVDRVVLLSDGPAATRLGGRAEVLPTGTRLGLLTGALAVRRRLRDATLVHANGVKAALVCALGLIGTGVPIVWVKHDHSWDGPLARMISARCAEVIGVSAAVLATLRRGTVIPNGVPEPTAAAERLGDEVVLLVGRLHPDKGQTDLVRAASALLRRRPGAVVAFAGGDDPTQPMYGPGVRRLAVEEGLGDERVLWLGHRVDAPALIAGADVLVVAGVEGFGLSAVEALAAGTPVVGYRSGALPEVLDDAAVLVGPGDTAALADAIAGVLEDPLKRAALARAGRDRYERRYRVEVMLAAYAERYRVLARRRG